MINKNEVKYYTFCTGKSTFLSNGIIHEDVLHSWGVFFGSNAKDI